VAFKKIIIIIQIYHLRCNSCICWIEDRNALFMLSISSNFAEYSFSLLSNSDLCASFAAASFCSHSLSPPLSLSLRACASSCSSCLMWVSSASFWPFPESGVESRVPRNRSCLLFSFLSSSAVVILTSNVRSSACRDPVYIKGYFSTFNYPIISHFLFFGAHS
jgi:hypothetical protein